MLASFLSDLKELINLGFSPFLALIVAFLIALAGVIGVLAAWFWRQITKAWKARDDARAEWHSSVEKRLGECETDREELRQQVSALDHKVARLSACPKRDCPMRLP